jgi:hypothetical protein
MKRRVIINVSAVAVALAALLLLAGWVGAWPMARPLYQGGAPTVVSYQGQVKVNGSPYNGSGYFKFAVVDSVGSTSYWSNDGTSAAGSEPGGGVELAVSGGLFNVLLGDTSLTNMTQALSAGVFSGPERYLRLWFSSDNVTFRQLSPDRRIAAVPYALQAEEAANADTVDGMQGADLEESAEIDADIAAHASVIDAHHTRYTDAEAFGAVLDSDGAGSGLDADTVDGMQGADFDESAEIDADIAAHASIIDAHHARYTDAEAFGAVLDNDGAGSGLDADTVDGMQGADLDESAEIDADIAAHASFADAHHARYTDAEAFGAVLDNDGSGSSLDADAVDGMEGADLEESAEIDSDIAAHASVADAHHARYTDAEAFGAVLDNDGAGSGLDADTVDGMHGAGLEESAEIDSDIATHGSIADAHHTRYTDAEAFGAVLDNDGSGSGLDADLLDGEHASAFAAAAHDHDSSYWKLGGNPGTDANTHFLGTTDHVSLTLGVGGTAAVRIDTAGNVGLGTDRPSERLTVRGNGLILGEDNPVGRGYTSANLDWPWHVYVSGKYAYVASCNNDRLAIFDVSDPDNIVARGYTSVNVDCPRSVYVSGKYAYVASNANSRLAIFDVSDADNIVARGYSSANLLYPRSVYVSGKYAYVACEDNDILAIFDVSDADNIVARGYSSANLDHASSVYVSGKYAYVASSYNDRLAIFDVSDPDNIVARGYTSTNLDEPRSVYVSGRYAYVASLWNDRLAIFDVSDPDSIVARGYSSTNLRRPFSVYVSDHYAYVVSKNTHSLAVFDVSDPDDIVARGYASANLQVPYSVYVSGKYAYVASADNDRLALFELNHLESPTLQTGNLQSGYLDVTDNAIVGNNLYVQGGLNVGPGGALIDGDVAVTGHLQVGEDGSGSGLDADKLDGQHGAFYQTASNINAGTLNSSRFSAHGDLSTEGYLGNAAGDLAQNNGVVQQDLNADKLDGQHASELELPSGAIVLGLANDSALTGAGYTDLGSSNVSTALWRSTSSTNAPSARRWHSAVWTGSEMLVWGGEGTSPTYKNDGSRYDPSTDTWTAITTTNAPTRRYRPTAVWTGSEMLVWGGYDGSYLNSGGRYNPAADTWTPITTSNAPSGRVWHRAVWTGSEMLVWGGYDGSYLNSGGSYNPSADTWTAITTTNAPVGRYLHTAVWTGSEMFVWGGGAPGSLDTGGRYNPATDTWTPITTTNAAAGRYFHTAVSTGSEMLVWGGESSGPTLRNDGGRYDPATDTWTAISTTNAPSARYWHTAVWTGSEMLVWGGEASGPTYTNDGGQYNPSTDTWRAMTTWNAPDGRESHTAVWTGSEMLVWAGWDGSYLSSGRRYRYRHLYQKL